MNENQEWEKILEIHHKLVLDWFYEYEYDMEKKQTAHLLIEAERIKDSAL